ncbi:MAG TPA: ATPase, T2SS/T4P/T4SS family [Dictyoglomaceae bacterium]|nr:ATPase, T2SS/T4P/T4SS family [Dictyoglomaceae bacterium]HOL39999.1 ATPase, T2SS/T4P/T4SS family [Dictyoglomaceae bacterium]HPP15596.1 ATPase, T2SS/T4P/T4SS family [Dictyoglomaceae bacterium]HPU42911.1 ATPase, T2SS/T4P/T4SS family [Dictyoglomaceae bacterium]
MKEKKPLGEYLLEQGLITKEQLEKALEEQKKTGAKLGQILIERGYVKPEDIGKVLERQSEIPYISPSEVEIDEKLVESFSESILRKYNFIPIKREGGVLHIAVVPPIDPVIINEIRRIVKAPVRIFITTEREFNQIMSKLFPLEKTTLSVVQDFQRLAPFEPIIEAPITTVEEAPIVKLVSSILNEAILRNASDIHLDPQEKEIRVRYRIHGILYDIMNIPKEIQDAVVTRVKVISGMDIAERRRPQDGRATYRYENRVFDLRVASIGTNHGEMVVIRLLDKTKVLIELDRLGMGDYELRVFESLIKRPLGMLLVTGPTGSGKTTTLYSALNVLNRPEENIITLEDPVEYELSGINQIQIQPRIGVDFATGLRNILRLDPNIIMVGEIRDTDTLNTSIEAALTGHLLLSTFHANDSVSAVIRLIQMGVEPFLIASSLIGIVAQRLVRTICLSCKEEYTPSKEEIEELGLNPEQASRVKLARGKGCIFCNYTGYSGRTGVFEILKITKEIRNLINNKASIDEIREYALKEGMRTLFHNAQEKVLAEVTTIEEARRVIGLGEG